MSSLDDDEWERMGFSRDSIKQARAAASVGPLRTMDLAALAGVDPSPVRFVVQGLLPAAETTLLTAPGGGNKTTLSLMIGVAMAARLDTVLGMAIEPGPVAMIPMEDAEARIHWGLHHICGGLGVSLASLAGRLHIASMRQVMHNGLAHFERDGELEPRDLYHQAQLLIEETGSKLLVLDNLAHLFLGNENDRMQATRFLGLLNKLASDTGAAILLLAHTPKSGDNFSGSTAWINAVRSHASIEKEEGGDPDVRVLKVSKGNYVKPGEVTRFRWFDHYLIRPEDLPPDIADQLAATSRAAAANDAFLRCLAAMAAQGRTVSHHPSVNYAPARFAKMPEAKGFDQDDLESAMERLLHLGTILADQEVGKYSNRQVRRGLKLADRGAQDGAQDPCQDGAQDPRQDAQDPQHKTHKTRTINTPPPTGEVVGDYGPPTIPLGGQGRVPGWVPGDD